MLGGNGMPSRKKHTNPFLLLIAIAICLVLGVTLRQSTVDFSVLEEKSTASASDHDKKEQTTPDSAQNTVSPSETSTPVPTEAPSASDIKVSDEAASGVWTSSGSSWLFMVDGKPYTGWLTDTDGKKYYFNKDGIMQTLSLIHI